MLHIILLQSLAQKIYIIGGTAATARLGNNQRGFIYIISFAFYGVQKLTDYQKGRVTGVVMEMCIRDRGSIVLDGYSDDSNGKDGDQQ